ncbi:hypothetical protein A6J42_16340 [Leptospira interrogans serovar Copenhageni]|uniref:Uncharacterized protein n=3 Tax=Leptospira interrogans TaxID=173 RepID=A0AAQ0AXU5_LEPIR|nr:conserved hypothetical protein [Leptospira interrogans serovar Copenhageni str. Fiocruz L1-130]ARB96848.1 hypothetical protein A6J42_16340 [Leptospira interrogans serovar Copenhageni]OOB93763.1 hypothetical protein B0191_16125 [Leptospira interrogans serovar Hardjo]QOI33564.1 hypothetical protein LeptoLang_04555 [Leptospira interrogans serovar Icterohaemorrhagiae]QOI41588.1 hypothetical protein Lepto782_04345 [Leptospira interrogans serovar Canicola]QOI49813.1 hypothetical protein Lepto1489
MIEEDLRGQFVNSGFFTIKLKVSILYYSLIQLLLKPTFFSKRGKESPTLSTKVGKSIKDYKV